MPRHNHNAHAPRIDTDQLATRVDQLAGELGAISTQDDWCLSSTAVPLGWPPMTLRDCLAVWLSDYLNCSISLDDPKVVTSNGR